MQKHPYAYCVHRDRLRKFSEDWEYMLKSKMSEKKFLDKPIESKIIGFEEK